MTAYDRMTASFELPVDATAEDVKEALEALGAKRVRIYPPRPGTSRPLGRME